MRRQKKIHDLLSLSLWAIILLQLFRIQVLSRDDQISRLNKDIADLQEQLSRKDSTLHKLDSDLASVNEDRRKVEDSVSIHLCQVWEE